MKLKDAADVVGAHSLRRSACRKHVEKRLGGPDKRKDWSHFRKVRVPHPGCRFEDWGVKVERDLWDFVRKVNRVVVQYQLNQSKWH